MKTLRAKLNEYLANINSIEIDEVQACKLVVEYINKHHYGLVSVTAKTVDYSYSNTAIIQITIDIDDYCDNVIFYVDYDEPYNDRD